MNYTQLNSSGAVVSSGSSGGSGGGSGSPSRSAISLGVYWNTAGVASGYQNTCQAVPNTNGNGLGGTPFIYRFDRPGAIVGINLVQCATPNANTWLQILKNGNVVDSFNMGTNGSGTPAPPKTFPNSTYVFAAGDVLQCNTMNEAAGNTQISAYATIEWL